MNFYLSGPSLVFDCLRPPHELIVNSDLAKSLCVVVWDHHVCPDFDFLSCDDESASGLHWKLSGSGRPHTETHDLEVARVRGPEPGKTNM